MMKNIFSKILPVKLFIIFLAVITMFIAGYCTIYLFSDKDARLIQTSIKLNKLDKLYYYFDSLSLLLNRFTYSYRIQELLKQHYSTQSTSKEKKIINTKIVQFFNHYAGVAKKKYGIRQYYLFDKDGNIIYSSLNNPNIPKNINSPLFKKTGLFKCYKKARKKYSVQDVNYFLPEKKWALYTGQPINYIQNRKKVFGGVIIFEIDPEHINSLLRENIEVGKTSQTILLGRDYKLRSNLPEDNFFNIALLVKDKCSINAINGQNNTIVTTDYNGKEVMCSAGLFVYKGINWGIVVKEDTAEIFELLNSYKNLMLLVSFILLILCIVLIYIYSKVQRDIIFLNNQYQTFLNAFDGLVLVFSRDHKIEFANSKFVDLIGKNVIGSKLEDVISDKSAFINCCIFEEVFDEKTVEKEIYNPLDNKYYDMLATPLDNDGQKSQLIILKDTHERKTLETKLLKSESMYKSLFTNMLSGCAYLNIIFDESGKPIDFEFLEVNDEFEKISRLKKEHVIGNKFSVLFPHHLNSKINLIELFGKVVLSGESFKQCLYFENTNQWVDLSVFKSGNGTVISIFENITESKLQEQKLIESEEHFRSIFEKFAISMALIDLNGRYIQTNPNASLNLGYTPEEFLKMDYKSLTHPDYLESTIKEFEALVSGKIDTIRGESKWICKDGHSIWVKVTRTLLRDLNGNPECIISMSDDITETKKKELNLKESEKRFRSLFENFSISMAILDLEGNYVQTNNIATKLLGYSFEDFKRIKYTDFLPAEHVEDTVRAFNALVKGEIEVWQAEQKWIAVDKSSIWVKNTRFVLKNDDDKPEYIISMSENITEGKKKEIALKESEEKFRSVFDNFSFNMALIGLDGKYIQTNKVANESLGYTSEEFKQITYKDITLPEYLEETVKAFEGMVKGEIDFWQAEVPWKHKDGSIIWARVTRSPLKDVDGKTQLIISMSDTITDQKLLEKAYKEKELKYSKLFENITSSLVVYEAIDNGEDFIIKEFNKTAEMVEQISREEVLGRKVTHAFPGIQNFGLFKIFQEVWRTGEPGYMSTNLYKDDRVIGWRENWVYKLSENEVVAIYNDTSELMKAHESLFLTKFSVDHSAIANLWIEREANIINVNQKACDLFGYSRDELIGMKMYDLDLNLPVELWQEKIWNDLKEKGVYYGESAIKLKSGAIIPVSFRSQYLKYGDREILFAFITDISERKQAERDLRLAQTSFNYSSLPTFWVTAEGMFYRVNQAACEYLEYSENELLQMNVHDIDKNYQTEKWREYWNDLKEHKFLTFETENITKTGKIIPVEISSSYFEFEGQIYNLAFIKDISERKKSEQVIIEQKVNLESLVDVQTNELKEYLKKLEALNLSLVEANNHKNKFISNMSHELRTPLNAIIGFSDLLQAEHYGTINMQQEEYLTIVQQSANHLLNLINDILDIAKIDSNTMDVDVKDMDPREFIDPIINMLKPQILNKSIVFSVNIDDNVKSVLADLRKCKQILLNIMSNSIKFTPQEGLITLDVQKIDNSFIKFSISDTGPGIKDEDKDKIFTEFFQSEELKEINVSGAGIGLALSKKLVNIQNGEMGFESQSGLGSTFWFTLPVGADLIPHVDEEKQEHKIESHQTSTNLILIAEDNPINMKLLTDILSIHNYNYIVAKDGLEAYNMAIAEKPELMLLDIKMPVMDGVELVQKLRELPEFKETPIIALTASAGGESRERHLKAGFNEQLDKPLSIPKLLNLLNDYLS